MKLNDCVIKESPQAELFLLCSLAAYEAARLGRDGMTQALLYVGESFRLADELADALRDDRSQNIIAALGVGVSFEGQPLDLRSLRYGKVILVTERTDSGRRSCNEILRFFSRYLPSLIEENHLFLAELPGDPRLSKQEFVGGVLCPTTRTLRPVAVKQSWEANWSGLE